jgi:hypothetical protein
MKVPQLVSFRAESAGAGVFAAPAQTDVSYIDILI